MKPKHNIVNKVEIPNQRLPKIVLAYLALVLETAVNHQALLVLKQYFNKLTISFIIKT